MSPNRTLCLVATLGQLGLVTASNYAAGPTPTTCAMTEVAEPPPQPTRPPAIHGFLQKRQDASASGANSLCGYVGGEVANPFYCQAGYDCVTNGESQKWACCNAAECRYFQSCVEESCDEACQSDPSVAKCTASGRSYCAQLTLFVQGDGPYTNWACAAQRASALSMYSPAVTTTASNRTSSASDTASGIELLPTLDDTLSFVLVTPTDDILTGYTVESTGITSTLSLTRATPASSTSHPQAPAISSTSSSGESGGSQLPRGSPMLTGLTALLAALL
ncbi:uncharacterized protein SEPMUDRAFT_129015 [Sphaerulina musiva SO2202]|uniref:Uncharacterized protein n=1 Tax=Sphaerulina musiva (strain SO2202) TaxID=692275 RepID=M3CWG1_SPHMS|nr:uncharacterized protein SEPMUDRAFT_129015 [Sphaerulina musiva SO2202]EMF08006.1 hypothetical protein SEPMUDRAFT_129015 [Sphaerulina musiva SO2202]